jgi:hypothetical protein
LARKVIHPYSPSAIVENDRGLYRVPHAHVSNPVSVVLERKNKPPQGIPERTESVGVAGLEPATSASQTQRAIQLRHTPNCVASIPDQTAAHQALESKNSLTRLFFQEVGEMAGLAVRPAPGSYFLICAQGPSCGCTPPCFGRNRSRTATGPLRN